MKKKQILYFYFEKSFRWIYRVMAIINRKQYIRVFPKHLHKIGINIDSKNTNETWISPDIWLDSSHYDLLTIGRGVVISFGVAIIVHDFSIVNACKSLDPNAHLKSVIFSPVTIGDYCFLGARCVILPGTKIGSNCIIGAAAVVKGDVPDGSIVVGNPGKIVGKTQDFARKYNQLRD